MPWLRTLISDIVISCIAILPYRIVRYCNTGLALFIFGRLPLSVIHLAPHAWQGSTQTSVYIDISIKPLSVKHHLPTTSLAYCCHILLGHQLKLDANQCGLICGAIEESSRSLKAIDKNIVFTHFHDKNAIFTSFCKKNDVFEIHDKNTVFGFVFVQDKIN